MDIDKQIIRAMKSHDKRKVHASFEQAYKMYKKLIFCCIYRYVPSIEDAEELTNDTFIKVFNNIDYLNETGSLKQYLAKIAKNKAFDFLKKKTVETCPLVENQLIVSGTEGESPFIVISKYLDDLELFIIIEHLVYDRSFQEIAWETKTSINTVSSKYRRSLLKLRKKIKKEELI